MDVTPNLIGLPTSPTRKDFQEQTPPTAAVATADDSSETYSDAGSLADREDEATEGFAKWGTTLVDIELKTTSSVKVLRVLQELLEEFAKASGEDVNHPLSKGFVDKIKEMFG